ERSEENDPKIIPVLRQDLRHRRDTGEHGGKVAGGCLSRIDQFDHTVVIAERVICRPSYGLRLIRQGPATVETGSEFSLRSSTVGNPLGSFDRLSDWGNIALGPTKPSFWLGAHVAGDAVVRPLVPLRAFRIPCICELGGRCWRGPDPARARTGA